MDVDTDELVSVVPIHLSNNLSPHIQIHQFPLLTRPLQVPPSAAASGKRIRARLKPQSARLEIHVPVDNRPEVWNVDRSKELGSARVQDDQEHSQELQKIKAREGDDPRLTEVRLKSEQILEKGVYMLGIMRDGQLHLHPISQSHQLRPTLSYLDVMMRKTKRSRGGGGASDSDSDDGPPPDPDEPPPPPSTKKAREKKPVDSTEVQVSVRTADEKQQMLQGAVSGVRREMLLAIRAEEEESWEELQYFDGDTPEASEAFEALFSQSQRRLDSNSSLAEILHGITGLLP